MKKTAIVSAAIAALAIAGCSSMGGGSGGWTTLVDGEKGLENFDRFRTANWTATDGAIQATQGGKEPAYLVSKSSYKDFMMRVEFWASDDANSGIFLRCADPQKVTAVNCYEVNIYDKRPEPSYGTGAIVDVAKVVPMPKAGGQWNIYEITAKGPQLIVTLNGTRTVDVLDNKLSRGPIALQYGAGVVKFRKVEIRPL